MRTFLTAVLLTSFASAEPAPDVVLDRASARTLLRINAPVKPRRIVPNLRHEADLTTLAEAVSINGEVGKIVVDGAASLRLRVTGATPGTVLLVAGEDELFERFEPSALATWTPTTRGSTVYIAVERGGAVAYIAELAAGTPQVTGSASACTKDVACTQAGDDPEVAAASRAIALIRFIRGDASYVCTGGLVNDSKKSGTPYLLTARHCISTPAEAASVEAIWDDRSTICGVTDSASRSVRTYGAELVVSSADTDVALLRLKKLPPDRVFLDVELAPLAAGTMTYRISHAEGKPQKYSAGKVRTSGAGCPTAPRPRYIYTTPTEGAVAMGSSGAPLLLPGLRVAGQLFALCGPSPNEPCAIYNDVVDGSIAASWPVLAPYLDPPAVARRRSARH